MEHIYYLPTRTTSLAHYFAKGIISPAACYTNKPDDIQENCPNALLINVRPVMTGSDCCIEVALTDDECQGLIQHDSWLLYRGMIPVTRIRRIHFADKTHMETTLANINISTAFLPVRLVDVMSGSADIPFNENLPDLVATSDNHPSVIRRFDRFMGAVAMLRLAGNSPCSPTYAATISFFNSTLRKIVMENAGHPADTRLQGIFDGSDGFSGILPLLEQPIDESVVLALGRKLGEEPTINHVTRLIDIDRISDKWLYVAAVLATYGTGGSTRRKRVDELISTRFSTIREGMRHLVSLCLGYHYGYSSFLKEYGRENPFKFRLDSRLDYYTIESIFRYTFYNRRVSDTFPAFEEWWPVLTPPHTLQKNEFMLIDQPVTPERAKNVSKPQNPWDELCLNAVKDEWFRLSPQQQYRRITSVVYEQAEQRFNRERKEYELRIKRLMEELGRMHSELECLKSRIVPENAKPSYPLATIPSPTIAGDSPTGYSALNADTLREIIEAYDSIRTRSDNALKAEVRKLGLKERPKAKKQDRIIQLLLKQMADNGHSAGEGNTLFDE